MNRQNKGNRSLLSMAGEQSLMNGNTLKSPINPKGRTNNIIIPSPIKIVENSLLFDPKQILKKLGLARLRKMQALIRGFIVRRTIYPKQLKDYLIAQSAMDLIISNVIYREASGIIVESVTLSHYDSDIGGQDRILQEYLYNKIIKRVVQKEFEPIARQAVYQTAIYASRPQITFGFNMRDPLQLTLFLKLDQMVKSECLQIAKQALVQQALERRQLQVIDHLIDSMGIVKDMSYEIIEECLLEGVGEYAVESMIEKINKEAAIVVSEVVYNEIVGEIQDKKIDSLVTQTQEWIIQELVISVMNKYQQIKSQ